MNGYNFTERVRKVIALARKEAVRLHHEYVSTEHILLGLVGEGEGVGATVLVNLSVNLDEVRQRIDETIKKGRSGQATGPDLPYTSSAKRVLELAMSEARELNHSYVGTEHLLLGLLRQQKGIAAQVLTRVGVDVDSVLEELGRILGTPIPMRKRRTVGSNGEAGAVLRPIRFTLQVECEGGTRFEEQFERATDVIAYLQAFPPGPRGRDNPPPPNPPNDA